MIAADPLIRTAQAAAVPAGGYSFSVTVILRASPPVDSDRNLARSPLANALELVAPLHQHQRIRRQQLIQPQRLQLPLAFQTIHIQVKELHRLAVLRAVVLVQQRKRGTRHLVRFGRIQRLGNALHQRRLARAQVAAQQQQLRRLQQLRQLAAHLNRVRAALGCELVDPAFAAAAAIAHSAFLARGRRR